MPKPKQERIVNDDGVNRTVEIETAAGGEEKGTVKATYTIPSNASAFQHMVLGLTDSPDGGAFVKSVFGPNRDGQDESPLAFVYRMYVSAIDKAQRASVYEAVQAESTIITVNGEKIDLMTYKPKNLVTAINGMRGHRASQLALLGVEDANASESADKVKALDKGLKFNQFQTAGRKLTEAGTAKENVATGMLELTAA